VALISCSGDHGLEDSCCIKSVTFERPSLLTASILRSGAFRGTAKDAKRTIGEPGHSRVKNDRDSPALES